MKENINKFAKYAGYLFVIVLIVVLVTDFLKRGIFNDRTGMNLLVVGDENVGILVIRPASNLVNWIPLPTNLKIKINNSPAVYPVKSLWSFGLSEKKQYQIPEKSIGDALGIIIPRMVKVDRVASVENLLGKFFDLNLSTDLSFRDRWVIRGLLSDAAISKKIFELEVPKNAFDNISDPDGKEFLSVNHILDVWAKDKFYHDDILEEGADLSINNLSDIAGAGLLLSNQLDSSGFRVVDVVNDKNDDVTVKGCHFLASDKFRFSVKYLEEQVGCQKIPTSENKMMTDNLIKIWLK